MTLGSSLLFAERLIFPKLEKKSTARRSLLGALICIGISLIPLTVVLSVSNGMIEGITQRIIGLSTSHLQVTIMDDESSITKETLQNLSDKLSQIEGVKASYAEVQGMALAASSKGRTGASIRSVPEDIFTTQKSFSTLFSIVDGSFDLSGKNNAVIGQKIANQLGLKSGDRFRLITTRNNNNTIIPRVTTFTVTGIISSGYQELDALWVFIPLQTGLSILPLESSQSSVKIEADGAFSSDLIRLSYDVQHIAGNTTRVYRWDELNASDYQNFASTKVLLMFIMLLIVLVASVNIFSALIMLSMERRREIAILKSFGASQNGIAFSFLITGLAVGFGGLLVGLPIGLALTVNINKILIFIEKILNVFAKFVYLLNGKGGEGFSKIMLLDPEYYLQNIPISIPFFELAVVVIGTLLLSLAASLIPAIRAGKEKPLETLRKI